MDYRQKLRLLGFVETIPLWVVKRWVLKRKADVIYHAFDADLANAKARNDTEEYRVLRGQQKYEIEECIDELHSIESYRLEMEAQSLYIHVPGLKWEDGRFGHRYLDRESLSKLYYAVKEQKDTTRDYRLKLAGAVTAAFIPIIGALIGLVAVWKRK